MINPYYNNSGTTIYNNDCLDVIKEMADNSIDSIITDPPYALSFMGQSWDKVLPAKEIWVECLRVAKPGAMMLVFGGDRTHHRLMVDIEDAGWEIRTCVYWLFGSGFPKSLDISKAIDKVRDWSKVEKLNTEITRARCATGLSLKEMGLRMQEITNGRYGKWYHRGGHMFFETGRTLPSRPEWEYLREVLPISGKFRSVYDEAERAIIGKHAGVPGLTADKGWNTGPFSRGESGNITIPATPEAQLWDGWGSGLKPAVEIIVLAMVPLDGTFAENALKHGVAGLNIDGGRIDHDEPEKRTHRTADKFGRTHAGGKGWRGAPEEQVLASPSPQGRYPSNLLLSHSPECRQTGVKKVKNCSGSVAGTEPSKTGSESTVCYGEYDRVPFQKYGKDGTETVPAYECVEGGVIETQLVRCGDIEATIFSGLSTLFAIMNRIFFHLGQLQDILYSHIEGKHSSLDCGSGDVSELSKLPSFRACCPSCLHFYDELVQRVQEGAQASSRQLLDAQKAVFRFLSLHAYSLQMLEIDPSNLDDSQGVDFCQDTEWSNVFGISPACENVDEKVFHKSDKAVRVSEQAAKPGNIDGNNKYAFGGKQQILFGSACIDALYRLLFFLSYRTSSLYIPISIIIHNWELSSCPVKMLDEQAGELKSGGGVKHQGKEESPSGWKATRNIGPVYKYNSGSASRFFYCAKSSRTEREAGLKGHIPCVKCGGLDTDFHLDDKGDKVKCVRNDHPTVKPQAILDYLCKLTMTPTGGVVLDMFGGTGTTALACEKIGRKCILIEKEKKSCDIAIARLKGLTKQGRLWDA